MYFLLERMTSLPVLVLGIGIVRSQSIGYWVLAAELGIVLTLLMKRNITKPSLHCENLNKILPIPSLLQGPKPQTP